MTLKEEIAKTIGDIQDWEQFSKDLPSTALDLLIHAEKVIDLLSNKSYGQLVPICPDYKDGKCQKGGYCLQGDCVHWETFFKGIKE